MLFLGRFIHMVGFISLATKVVLFRAIYTRALGNIIVLFLRPRALFSSTKRGPSCGMSGLHILDVCYRCLFLDSSG